MSVDSISAYAAQTAAAAHSVASASGSSGSAGVPQISQSDFLSLITAQLKAQDPTHPADPNQFVNELASLSEVSGINGMESSMGNLSSTMQSSQLLTGTSLIGRHVLAAGTNAALSAGGSVSGAVPAPSGADSVTIQVTDSTGALVKTMEVPPSSSGLTNFTWDGTTNSGAAAPAGTYKFSAAATTGGTQTSLSPFLASTVNSVTIDPTTQTLYLNTSSGTLSLSNVVQVN
ncbi:MAG TPA: FlgD immunoglobulin-like domain containing protein [Steroidobacteraceae bacterium]|jgi:flagellar basal-body rod modification protein FlgD|nr:FlgD immunoglobulin-like domain containing protein [Steroidobacteraceae bacterium]